MLICFLLLTANYKSMIVSKMHTILKPFDTSVNMNNWLYGGSTVLTSNNARLVPGLKGKVGWLKSVFPIPSNNWQVIIEFEVSNKVNQGWGDGMAIHFIDDSNDSSNMFASNDGIISDIKNAGVMGLVSKNPFFSIVVADDEKIRNKNHPFVTMFDNMNQSHKYYHNKKNLKQHMSKAGHGPFNCHLYNNVEPGKFKLIISLDEKNVRVIYSKLQNGKENKYLCVDAELTSPIKHSTYMAFSAVNDPASNYNDAYIIESIVTRYSDEKDPDDDSPGRDPFFHYYEKESSWFRITTRIRRFFWLVMAVCGIFLLLECIWELNQLSYISSEKTESAIVLNQINQVLPFSYALQLAIFAIFLFRLKLVMVALLSVLCVKRIYNLIRSTYKLSSTDFDFSSSCNNYVIWLYCSCIVHALFTIYSVSYMMS